jgi:hypothetical protein
LENEITVTVVFPDATLPTNLNGGFATQDEFREYVMTCHQTGRWDSFIHARPSAVRVADYTGEALAKAFPLVFPFGHSGCAEDPAIAKLIALRKQKRYFFRSREKVLQKYLLHRKPTCHGALFNLIVGNILMKNKVFNSVRLQANYRHTDGVSLGERFGMLKPDKLNMAINAVRNNNAIQYSSSAENQFLRSIHAVCRDLPQSNEASIEARKIYFSYLMHFGLPAVFLTITPDDGRNYRIVLYALSDKMRTSLPDVDVSNLSDDEIMAEFKIRQQCRTSYPGLCAEEYHRIMTLVIKHLFQWDEKEQSSTGQGCFGELLAWCLATEEQGRKTLHGHFLLFLKNWQPLMRLVQLRDRDSESSNAQREMNKFCANISSAQLFADFESPNGLLCDHKPFEHDNCVHWRGIKRKRLYACEVVDDQVLRDMRHKKKCRIHCGLLGKCPKCNTNYTVNEIVTSALKHHLGLESYQYPDTNRRLDRFVYNAQHDKNWYKRDEKSVALRYFANNALVNIHSPFHATRCFYRSQECFANLPEMPLEKNTIHFKEAFDVWFDFKGDKEQRFMFRFYPKRNIEDVFMNVHSTVLTKCFANNTNVLAAMNGPVVFYVTGYQAKKQQKEERQAYTKVSETIFKMIQKTNNDDPTDIPPSQEGFRRLLAGIYTQTSAHIVAAPMAHYLALHGSRFRFSHDSHNLPVIGIENYLLGQNTTGTMRIKNGKPVWYHQAMDYIYRDQELEHLNMLQFCQKMETIWTSEAEKRGCEFFAFTENHAFRESHCIVYRTKTCVASFPWNWLGSTAEFEFSLTIPVASTHKDYSSREDYCRKFLMLFVPFRNLHDLKKNFNTFQEGFRYLQTMKKIPDDVKRFANNIQDIHNSIRVSMPTNMLSDATFLDDDTMDDTTNNLCSTDEQEAHLLATIETTLAETANIPVALSSTATNVSPQFLSSTNEVPKMVFESIGAMQVVDPNAVVYETIDFQSANESDNEIHVPSRFVTTVSELNTLVYRSLLVPEDSNLHNQTSNATGSVASIIEWCKNDRLDTNQQIAVEIIVATYILTFYEDASAGEAILHEKEGLCRLARQRPNTNETLRMYITGPAGAGKCKEKEKECNRHVLHSGCSLTPKYYSKNP